MQHIFYAINIFLLFILDDTFSIWSQSVNPTKGQRLMLFWIFFLKHKSDSHHSADFKPCSLCSCVGPRYATALLWIVNSVKMLNGTTGHLNIIVRTYMQAKRKEAACHVCLTDLKCDTCGLPAWPASLCFGRWQPVGPSLTFQPGLNKILILFRSQNV